MQRQIFVLCFLFSTLTWECFAQSLAPPNFVVILADDLGFSDLGCYGGEIETPTLDLLATNGIRFTNFYNTGRCWPTRAALLTGYYPHQVGFDDLPGEPIIKRSSKRPNWAPLLPESLSKAGYRSYHCGKWHLDGRPFATGFTHSYCLNDHGRFFSPTNHLLDDRKIAPVEPGSSYYSTTAIADHALDFLREHQSKFSAEPFFLFLAFTAPHFPLQAKPSDVKKYRDRYQSGWNAIRNERWSRIRKMGLIDGELPEIEENIGPPYAYPEAMTILGEGEINRPRPWIELTATQKDFQATKMSIHAAMVDCMDQEIGRVVDQLKKMGAYENTVIFFLSDNGASSEIMVRDDGHDPNATPGSAATHLCLGPGFSSVANAPFRRHKTWVHEGGIHTPLIVHWPKGISSANSLNKTVGHVVDIPATILDLAGQNFSPLEKGLNAPPSPAISLKPALVNGEELNHSFLWWSHEGNRALREGDMKIVSANNEPWELYDLALDPTETKNLAEPRRADVENLEKKWTAFLNQIRKQVESQQ